jgi:glycosyltransferase involved in cell wall biosynthesis
VKTTLFIPTLNEIDGMRAIMPRVRRDWFDQILVLDGKSKDGTAEYAREQGYDVIVQSEPGLRQGYREAWPHIRGDVVVTFSPDGNSIPELLPPLLEKMREGYDMVIVSRYARGARSLDDDFLTKFGNWMFNRVVNLLHGGRFTDVMVIYRAYRTDLVRELGLLEDAPYRIPERLFRTRISWEPLLSVRAASRRLRCAEIPGDEPPRVGGERKLQMWRWGASYLWQMVWDLFAPGRW